MTVQQKDYETMIRVKDTGIGISEESRERIFERFYRVDKSRSKEVGGTGLGLSIVKHAVMIHNGSIEVKSKVGEGTEMIVFIPNGQGIADFSEKRGSSASAFFEAGECFRGACRDIKMSE